MPSKRAALFGQNLGQAIQSGSESISQAIKTRYLNEAKKAQDKADRAWETAKYLMGEGLEPEAAQYVSQNIENIPSFSQEYAASQIPSSPGEQRVFSGRPAGTGGVNIDLISKFEEWKGLKKKGMKADISYKEAIAGKKPTDTKPPTGYRWNGKELEVIPGGPADVKNKDKKQKELASVTSSLDKIGYMTDTVDTSLGQVGAFTSGFFGSSISKIPGTEAANLFANLQTIEANLGFDKLAEMRAQSPTGGALGQVSERELALLTSSVRSLKQSQSPAQLRKHLEEIKDHLKKWETIQETYKESLLSGEIKKTKGTSKPRPSAEDRFKELEKSGLSEEQIYSKLGEEGY